MRRTMNRLMPSSQASFNMTPMIDCTFQLIIFFVIGGQIASNSLAPVELARPLESQAVLTEQLPTPRVIVNVLAAKADSGATPGTARWYEIDGHPIPVGDAARLVDVFTARKASVGEEDFCVEIRADQRVDYGQIEPIIDAARAAGIGKLNMTALMGPGV